MASNTFIGLRLPQSMGLIKLPVLRWLLKLGKRGNSVTDAVTAKLSHVCQSRLGSEKAQRPHYEPEAGSTFSKANIASVISSTRPLKTV
jgi:hypothetical protein